ncbi:hypothetical protein RHSIM_Rhsim02G0178000 [Rhododendron simsii]|uniref:Helitron helicase n=1 Tax=Rhododendron simsii TaxID=118357 RepID=A0A834HCR0_RHOSS|nr:hypothetical protein RHSIM_Rhsim02G0178000 [Rhododendron simsii]
MATAHAPHAQSLLDKELLTIPGTSLASIHQLPPENQSIDDDELEDESTNIGVDPQANRYLNRHYLACMENEKCTKKYPEAISETTTMDQDGYPIYRRRNDGRVYTVRGHPVDNRDVVPYNTYLSRLCNYHINVEVCAGMKCVKYIYKYNYKGNDRATIVLGPIDEIKAYLDARYIDPVEAA